MIGDVQRIEESIAEANSYYQGQELRQFVEHRNKMYNEIMQENIPLADIYEMCLGDILNNVNRN